MTTWKLVVAALVTAVAILVAFAAYELFALNNDAPKVIPTPPPSVVTTLP